MNKQDLLYKGIIGLCLYLISTGLAFAYFTNTKAPVQKVSLPAPGTASQPSKRFDIDPSIPRTESCPINGVSFTKEEKDAWALRRPLAVMIENHEESRPQSGLSFADVIYESVAEGGITRFMGIFYCGVAGGDVLLAPVRSARTYYLPWVLEYDALYNHVGGAGRCNDPTVDPRAKALCQIDQWKIKDMDQFGISFPTCYRNYDRLDHPVATEHTMVCSTNKLYKLGSDRGWTHVDAKGVRWDKGFESWKFKDDAKAETRGLAGSISFVAWAGYESDYGVRFEYDPATNIYKRFSGDKPHEDLETKEQLAAKVVVIQFAKETGPVDEHKHLLYNNVGSGDGLLFQDGKGTKVTWRKGERTSRTKFYESGKEVTLNRGQIWVVMLPVGTNVSY